MSCRTTAPGKKHFSFYESSATLTTQGRHPCREMWAWHKHDWANDRSGRPCTSSSALHTQSSARSPMWVLRARIALKWREQPVRVHWQNQTTSLSWITLFTFKLLLPILITWYGKQGQERLWLSYCDLFSQRVSHHLQSNDLWQDWALGLKSDKTQVHTC